MRLVVDTNILFTYFWENSAFREMCDDGGVELFSPIFALKEIDKYKKEIMKKTKISPLDFVALRKEMASYITFIDKGDCEKYYKEVKASLKGLSIKEKEEILEDADFLAASHMVCCPLWSNDKLLKKQKEVIVLNTEEIVTLLDV